MRSAPLSGVSAGVDGGAGTSRLAWCGEEGERELVVVRWKNYFVRDRWQPWEYAGIVGADTGTDAGVDADMSRLEHSNGESRWREARCRSHFSSRFKNK